MIKKLLRNASELNLRVRWALEQKAAVTSVTRRTKCQVISVEVFVAQSRQLVCVCVFVCVCVCVCGHRYRKNTTGLSQRRTGEPACLYRSTVNRLQSVLWMHLRGWSFSCVTATVQPHHWRTCHDTLLRVSELIQNRRVDVRSSWGLQHVNLVYLSTCPIYRVGVVFALPALIIRLVVPLFKLSTIRSRTFKVLAAQTWHCLPEDVTSSPTLPKYFAKVWKLILSPIIAYLDIVSRRCFFFLL